MSSMKPFSGALIMGITLRPSTTGSDFFSDAEPPSPVLLWSPPGLFLLGDWHLGAGTALSPLFSAFGLQLMAVVDANDDRSVIDTSKIFDLHSSRDSHRIGRPPAPQSLEFRSRSRDANGTSLIVFHIARTSELYKCFTYSQSKIKYAKMKNKTNLTIEYEQKQVKWAVYPIHKHTEEKNSSQILCARYQWEILVF